MTYRTVFPEVFSVALFFAFVIVAVSFFMYDVLVDRRNETLVDKFARSNAIVASLFPKNYLSKLMGDDDEDNNNNNNKNAKSKSYSGHKSLKALMSGDDAATNALVNKKDGSLNTNSKPLAEVFPNVTILFAGKKRRRKASMAPFPLFTCMHIFIL